MIGTCAAALTLALLSQSTWPTLAEELAKHGMEATELSDADGRITSYAVLNKPGWFAVAYYWDNGSDLLPDTVRVRTTTSARSDGSPRSSRGLSAALSVSIAPVAGGTSSAIPRRPPRRRSSSHEIFSSFVSSRVGASWCFRTAG